MLNSLDSICNQQVTIKTVSCIDLYTQWWTFKQQVQGTSDEDIPTWRLFHDGIIDFYYNCNVKYNRTAGNYTHE